ncbi:shikimate kinase [Bacillus sp. FJAT-49736]|uniref:shikimate kinase n=1 Tax=Bacillus sp. FJAT-49736 TaxID=2833582 RepID=UPI001BCA02C5|nr:shikimate kinase [Bacillus sp. FJAT-49736]MBS4173449.1 shikimate kinase [Bacillus sp. FJAT-49736]
MFPLYIIGFMGAGKTTIGKKLSDVLDISVFDTDHLVEQQEGKRIPEIFSEKGEHYFRDKESEILTNTKNMNAIITTGGGIILRKGNRELIKSSGVSVFLQCDIEIIMKRLQNDTSRPLLMNKKLEEVKALFELRMPYYEEAASFTIDTSFLTVPETVEEILKRIK